MTPKLTAKKIAAIRAIDTRRMKPKKAVEVMGQVLVDNKTYFSPFVNKLEKRDEQAAQVMRQLADLVMQAGYFIR